MAEIKIDHLVKKYGHTVILNDVSCHLRNGIVGLLGRNGAGKTTLIKILVTLLTPNEGHVEINQVPISEVKQIRRIIGYLPQDFQIYNNMQVKEALNYLGLLSEINQGELTNRISQLLAQLDLTAYTHQKIKKLSGGLKQRVGIAQALLNNPQVLVIDEPTVGLDPEERDRFKKLLIQMSEDRIILLSTHIVSDIAEISNQLLVLENGRFLFTGETKDFALNPKQLEEKYLGLIRK